MCVSTCAELGELTVRTTDNAIASSASRIIEFYEETTRPHLSQEFKIT